MLQCYNALVVALRKNMQINCIKLLIKHNCKMLDKIFKHNIDKLYYKILFDYFDNDCDNKYNNNELFNSFFYKKLKII